MAEALDIAIEDYDALTRHVASSDHRMFAGNLKRWLRHLETDETLAPITKRLAGRIDFDEWRKSGLIQQNGMGLGQIKFPDDNQDRLSVQINLCRWMAEEEDNGWQFAHTFFSADRSLDRNIEDLNYKFFEPFSDDLRRHILRNARVIPASDQYVSLDHNSQGYADLISSIDRLTEALRGLNNYDDPDEKSQRLAELEAGKLLAQAPRTRLEALFHTLGIALRKLKEKTIDKAIDHLLDQAINYIILAIPTAAAWFAGLPL